MGLCVSNCFVWAATHISTLNLTNSSFQRYMAPPKRGRKCVLNVCYHIKSRFQELQELPDVECCKYLLQTLPPVNCR